METPTPPRHALFAYAGPFVVFCALLLIPGCVKPLHPDAATPWWLAAPEFWVYPLQTVLCGAMLLFFRRDYPRAASPMGLAFATGIGLLVFVLWVSPQAFFRFPPRTDGFNPQLVLFAHRQPLAVWDLSHWAQQYQGPVGAGTPAYWATVIFRFVRLVVVVPWLEEVFWRGFLLRYLIKENFLAVPFGTFGLFSFGAVTAGFMLEHQRVDYPAALAAGVLYNWVAIRTRSLPACILAHALTNLLLGAYVMHTRQWGFW